jgi:hypothetical protein
VQTEEQAQMRETSTLLVSANEATASTSITLSALPTGARLIVRCRADWRVATVSESNLERITLSVGSPSGRTYRIRRPPETIVSLDGSIPILGEGTWRAALARYDARW